MKFVAAATVLLIITATASAAPTPADDADALEKRACDRYIPCSTASCYVSCKYYGQYVSTVYSCGAGRVKESEQA
ncbi:uncharacterized protein LOC62_02G003058 [Vanrija pseudolonga]|uniref:Uncharacterized protein n=1 Tax=Vanrija pseudolonga TaxID=143232 RepID=A0AAF0Y7B7_9TREE|nr:hypothetical protein LOC62_02G003058 [Vanrija pseudolonga]